MVVDPFGQEVAKAEQVQQFGARAHFGHVDGQVSLCNGKGAEDPVVVVLLQSCKISVSAEVVEQVGVNGAGDDLPHPGGIKPAVGQQSEDFIWKSRGLQGICQFVLRQEVPQAFHRIVPGEEFALVFEGMAERKVGNVVDERCEHHSRLLLGANRHAVVPEGADDAPGHCRGPQRVFESGVHTPRVDQVGRAGLPDAPQALHLAGVHNAAFRIGEAEVSVDGVPNDHESVLSG